MKEFYPIFLDLTDRFCAVIGGGGIALRKARAIADAGGKLRIVSLEIRDEIIGEFSKDHEIHKKKYEPTDLDDVFLVVAATDDKALNSRISSDAREMGILVNVVDQPADCDFYVPSVIKKGAIKIAVSTGGESPAMAGWIKREIERLLPGRLEEGLGILADARKQLIESDPEAFDKRVSGFRDFFESDIWRDYLAGKRDLEAGEVVAWFSSCSV